MKLNTHHLTVLTGYDRQAYYSKLVELSLELFGTQPMTVEQRPGGYEVVTPLTNRQWEELDTALLERVITPRRAQLTAACKTTLVEYVKYREYCQIKKPMGSFPRDLLTPLGLRVLEEVSRIAGRGGRNRGPKCRGANAKGLYLKYELRAGDEAVLNDDGKVVCPSLKDALNVAADWCRDHGLNATVTPSTSKVPQHREGQQPKHYLTLIVEG